MRWTLIILVVVGLVTDAIVHYDLASAFSGNKTGSISEPTIFRIQATVSLIAALAVLARPRRYTAGFAFLVGASAFVAVVVYRYADLGKIGPIPNMYDPYWAPAGKVLSAIGEAVAAIAALALVAVLSDARPATARTAGRPGAAVGSGEAPGFSG